MKISKIPFVGKFAEDVCKIYGLYQDLLPYFVCYLVGITDIGISIVIYTGISIGLVNWHLLVLFVLLLSLDLHDQIY
jgi:hypothetical protein